MKDYYKILEITQSATLDEIKKSFRRLALIYHPDRNPGDKVSEGKFKEINEAYEILTNNIKRKKYDDDYNTERQVHSNKCHQKKTEEKGEERPLTPTLYLETFSKIRRQAVELGRKQVHQQGLYQSLDKLLDESSIKFLLSRNDEKINRQIIHEVFICCKYLAYPYVDRLSVKLAKLAGTDNDSIRKIYLYNKKRKLFEFWNKERVVGIAIAAFLIIVFTVNALNPSSLSSDNAPKNGDLNSTFVDKGVKPALTDEQKFQKKKDSLIADGWVEEDIQNGQLPACYNFKPKTSNINNYLEVVVGSGTDVSIKVMNLETNNCVRYVFINSVSTYRIKNIPEGRYYLKIAYGKNWFSRVVERQCIGKFIRNPIYEKGEDILDFNLEYTKNGHKIPSFRLHLDIIASDISNSFDSKKISETEFNK
ncbi:MAG: DnaJ domain-containing protein [Chitinophagaceae bacterium]|nr:DnaJ domain-containing protein [Chitinophagaceae bacterium]